MARGRGRPKRSIRVRFFEKVKVASLFYEDEGTTCWEWQGYVGKYGYGRFYWPGAPGRSHPCRLAHRASWVLHNGRELTSDEVVMHRCDNRRCVNPTHLLAGTHSDNMQDMIAKGRGKGQFQRCESER